MQTPSTVKISFWIILLGLIADVVFAIIILTAGISLMNSGESGTLEGYAVSGGMLLTVSIGALVLALIELLVLSRMKAGRNWARIVVSILEILSIAAVVTQPHPIGWVALVLSIIALVLMWVPTSNAYFRSSAA